MIDKINLNTKKIIPIFYACDDAFIKYTVVSIKSLLDNADKNNFYKIYILNAGASEDMKKEVYKLKNQYADIQFVCVKEQIEKIGTSLPIRDYYSKTTYFRFFIAEMFPEYDKAIYIDSDTVVLGDISEFFSHQLENNLVGACHEQAMIQTEVFGNYVEKVMGISKYNYFNAGHLLINCKKFREEGVLRQFLDLLNVYTFTVTQDQDYLNVICHNRVLWINDAWNTEVYGKISVEDNEIKMIHYIMVNKPWHYHDCKLKDPFWNYAKQTDVYNLILDELNNYSQESKERDQLGAQRLARMAEEEAKREDRYLNIVSGKNVDRLKVLEKIRVFETNKTFDVDVENDPKTIPLLPDKIDYLGEKFKTRFFTKIANKKAVAFYEKQIQDGTFMIDEIHGLENYRKAKGGAMITCNHFSAFDNYVVYRAIKDELNGRYLYKVIREGNYTNFKGIYGFFFRHCNTLPLSSNIETMKKFMNAISVLLKRGEKILIYPEQAMWWNYKKPRPLKSGAFKFAVKNNVPIIPAFITLEKSGKIGADGFDIPKHSIWFLPPIYKKPELSDKDNVEYMKNENFRLWQETYERVYGVKLEYANG